MSNDNSAFESIWEFIILKSIDLCELELDKNFKEKAEVSVCNLELYKEKLRKIYIKKREWLKREYLPNEENPILDFHKLSAIMCRSIIGIKPFYYDVSKAEEFFSEVSKSKQLNQSDKVEWQVNNVYVNYKLAFLVAEGIIFTDLLFWVQCKINCIKEKYSDDELLKNIDNSKTKIDIYEELIFILNSNEYRLYHYKGSNSHDNFIISAIISLMKNDYLKRDFDYLQFSLSMFQWQEYTKKQHIYDIIKRQNQNITLSDLI